MHLVIVFWVTKQNRKRYLILFVKRFLQEINILCIGQTEIDLKKCVCYISKLSNYIDSIYCSTAVKESCYDTSLGGNTKSN